MVRYHYSYQQIFGNQPNDYPFLYYVMPTESLIKKNGIVQQRFPWYHLYYPYSRFISSRRNLFPVNRRTRERRDTLFL